MIVLPNPSRRGFVAGLVSALAAPAIIPYADLMPVKKVIWTPEAAPVPRVPLTRAGRYLVEAIDPLTGRIVDSFLSPTNDLDLNEKVMRELAHRKLKDAIDASLNGTGEVTLEHVEKLRRNQQFFVKMTDSAGVSLSGRPGRDALHTLMARGAEVNYGV